MAGIVYRLGTKDKTKGERGMPKPYRGEIFVTKKGAEGDYNKYRMEDCQGDLNKALLIMPLETIVELNQEDWPIEPGDLGENITASGVPYDFFVPGEKYKIGEEVVVEISEPCKPCKNLRVLSYVGDRVVEFNRVMVGRRGWYAKVISGGRIRREDSIMKDGQ